jgi:S1-C subfamily serine protease
MYLGDTMKLKNFGTAVVLGLAGAFVFASILDSLISYEKTTNKHLANNTVSLINSTGGGTGVILDSLPILSRVLTNRHVCNHIEHGGVVKNDKGDTYTIISFKTSTIHDLCEVIVSGDLNGHVSLADEAPSKYDESIVAGHPHLLPTVITHGYFEGRFSAQFAINELPLEGQLITNLVSPGSSGSAVYNRNGDLAGLVFAGSSNFSLSLIVPYKYLKLFLEQEVKTLEPKYILPEISAFNLLSNQSKNKKAFI